MRSRSKPTPTFGIGTWAGTSPNSTTDAIIGAWDAIIGACSGELLHRIATLYSATTHRRNRMRRKPEPVSHGQEPLAHFGETNFRNAAGRGDQYAYSLARGYVRVIGSRLLPHHFAPAGPMQFHDALSWSAPSSGYHHATRSLATDLALGFPLTVISTSRPSLNRNLIRRSIEKTESFPCFSAETLG